MTLPMADHMLDILCVFWVLARQHSKSFRSLSSQACHGHRTAFRFLLCWCFAVWQLC